MTNNPADMVPFAKTLGVQITGFAKDKIEGELEVRPELCTYHGNDAPAGLHGGAIMGFADNLGAFGAFLNLPKDNKGTTTIESKTNFLSAAPVGSVVKGVSIPIHIGRRTSVWQTTLSHQDGKPIAVVTQTQMVL